MATGPSVPGATNVFIPVWSASGRLGVSFVRNPKTFPYIRYTQLIHSPKVQGYFLKIGAQQAARIANLSDALWNFGAEAPKGPENLEQFQYIPFFAQRRAYPFFLDDDTERQAEWEVGEEHTKITMQRAATSRAIQIINEMTNVTHYQTNANSGDADEISDLTQNHTNTATAFAGGNIDQGTSTNPYLKIFLDKASVLIDIDSLGTVRPEQLRVVMNPNTARLIAESAEIHDYLKGSPDAMHEIRTGSSPNAKYGPGLPSAVYGMEIVVENTVKVTSLKGATLNKVYAFPDQTVAIISRVGELDGVYGTPSWSSMTWFWYRDDMTVERKHDPDNRRDLFRVVDCGIAKLTSPITAFLLTSATSKAS